MSGSVYYYAVLAYVRQSMCHYAVSVYIRKFVSLCHVSLCQAMCLSLSCWCKSDSMCHYHNMPCWCMSVVCHNVVSVCLQCMSVKYVSLFYVGVCQQYVSSLCHRRRWWRLVRSSTVWTSTTCTRSVTRAPVETTRPTSVLPPSISWCPTSSRYFLFHFHFLCLFHN